MKDLGSPIQAFIRDWCVVEPIATIAPKELFEGWRFWCEDQGKEKSGSLQVFGRDLRAALPAIRMTQPNTDGERERRYSGIRLCPERMAHIAHEKMVRQQRKQGGQNDTD